MKRSLYSLLMLSSCSFGENISLPSSVNNKEIIQNFDYYANFYEEAKFRLKRALELKDNEAKIKEISDIFLGVPYVSHTLSGSNEVTEELVVNFGAVDCFTFLDYVEALRRSDSLADLSHNIISTRYFNEDVSYISRRHFFSDWVSEKPFNAYDVTGELSSDAISVRKILNKTKEGNSFVPNLAPKVRYVSYISSDDIDKRVVGRLETGDYIGIYSEAKGLDVSHTGIYINTDDGPMLRHASSKPGNMKVVDSPFYEYISNVPGIVVYRATDR
ncbi:N-acetylmuramoyl-L-alanine amidase-like domain-containing protein [Vibrio owensii]|uniref:N-acetylmuramoyl-L-alanine amidase-like domain-containing protein n=1 Tax=Vibrio owensii TaxID=696485 RepID=UPI0003A2BA6E|nr:N-acetylmuramoyl-L-alanine amidase-like domain-containing protein [Vibrio owensii]